MSKDKISDLLNLIKKSIALNDLGIFYAHNEFDKNRYKELKEINLEMLDILTEDDVSLKRIKDFHLPITEYPTAKVEVRGVVLDEESRILMVSEKIDGKKWSLPGGLCDVGSSPREVIEKEIYEETGLEVEVTRLLAVNDKKFFNHQEESYYTYQIYFLCEKKSGNLDPDFDIEAVKYFEINKLPELSTIRVVKEEIELVYNLAQDKNSKPYFN